MKKCFMSNCTYRSYVTKPGRYGRFSHFGKIVGRYLAAGLAKVFYYKLKVPNFYLQRLEHFDDLPRLAVTQRQPKVVDPVFIYRFLVPCLQLCAVLDAHVKADQYRVNNFKVVQVSTAAQNRPQGRDAAELTISQLHDLDVVEKENEVQGHFAKVNGVQG
jgi:hypothetical protein